MLHQIEEGTIYWTMSDQAEADVTTMAPDAGVEQAGAVQPTTTGEEGASVDINDVDPDALTPDDYESVVDLLRTLPDEGAGKPPQSQPADQQSQPAAPVPAQEPAAPAKPPEADPDDGYFRGRFRAKDPKVIEALQKLKENPDLTYADLVGTAPPPEAEVTPEPAPPTVVTPEDVTVSIADIDGTTIEANGERIREELDKVSAEMKQARVLDPDRHEELSDMKLDLRLSLQQLDTQKAEAAREVGWLKQQQAASSRESYLNQFNESQDIALDLYPDLKDNKHKMWDEIDAIHAEAKTNGDSVVKSPNFPAFAAAQAAARLGIVPKKLDETGLGDVVEGKDFQEIAAPPVQPASGDARSTAPASQNTVVQELTAELDKLDPMNPDHFDKWEKLNTKVQDILFGKVT